VIEKQKDNLTARIDLPFLLIFISLGETDVL
jgi:hypothetical protein